jgi:hypothetical protein
LHLSAFIRSQVPAQSWCRRLNAKRMNLIFALQIFGPRLRASAEDEAEETNEPTTDRQGSFHVVFREGGARLRFSVIFGEIFRTGLRESTYTQTGGFYHRFAPRFWPKFAAEIRCGIASLPDRWSFTRVFGFFGQFSRTLFVTPCQIPGLQLCFGAIFCFRRRLRIGTSGINRKWGLCHFGIPSETENGSDVTLDLGSLSIMASMLLWKSRPKQKMGVMLLWKCRPK